MSDWRLLSRQSEDRIRVHAHQYSGVHVYVVTYIYVYVDFHHICSYLLTLWNFYTNASEVCCKCSKEELSTSPARGSAAQLLLMV